MQFLGIDLGWQGKPSGLALVVWDGKRLKLEWLGRPETHVGVLAELDRLVGPEEAAWVGVDAPAIIRNETGTRAADRMAHSLFARQRAGAYPVNRGLPFARAVLGFMGELAARGFRMELPEGAQGGGRQVFEVFPHAASLRLFGLPQILPYKKGPREERRRAMLEFRALLEGELRGRRPALRLDGLPLPGETLASLKECEDQLDAVLCAYVAAHYWYWGLARTNVLGDPTNGYIINPSF